MNTQLAKFLQIWLHCQLLLVTVSAIAFDTWNDGGQVDEATFVMDEIGCPGIPTKKIDLKQFFGDWYLPYTSENWMRYDPKPGPRPRFGIMKKPLKKAAYANTCIKSTIRPMPSYQLPIKRWKTGNVKHPQNGTFVERPQTDYSNLWIRTKSPLSGQESNLNCKPYPMAGNLAANARLVCVDFSSALAPPSEFYIVDTDNQNYALVVSCAPISLNDDNDRKPNINAWAIFVKMGAYKVLRRELVKELLGLVQHIGFKVGDIIEIPYEKCRY